MKTKILLPGFLFVALMISTASFCIVPPHFLTVDIPSSGILYEKYEITFTTDQYTGGTANPYDPTQFDYYAEFWSPSGKHFKVNAFFFNDAYSIDACYWHLLPGLNGRYGSSQEVVLTSSKSWKVRFSPNELSGDLNWRVRLVAHNIYGQTYYPSSDAFAEFSCMPSNDPLKKRGFVKMANRKYLNFSDGSPFYPVGVNAPCWKYNEPIQPDPPAPPIPYYPGCPNYSEPGSCQIKSWIDNMVDNNINFFLYNANTFQGMNIFGIDWRDGKNYYSYFNQKDSWQLDDIINYAHTKDVYIQMVLFSHAEFGNLSYCANSWNTYNPFYTNCNYQPTYPDMAGTCSSPFDFITDPGAKQIQKNLIRYIVARWGYSTSIASWEIFDEIDNFNYFYSGNYGSPYPEWRNDLTNWHLEMKDYIHSMDPQKHLVLTNTNTWTPSEFFDINRSMDMVVSKIYRNLGPNSWENVDIEKDIFDWAQQYYPYYWVPYMMTEVGYLKDLNSYQTYDPHMYGLHGILWSSLFSGPSGVSCYWTLQDIYWSGDGVGNYRGIGKFASKLQAHLSEEYVPNFINSAGNSGLTVYCLQNSNTGCTYGWAQDLNYKFLKIMRTSMPNAPNYLQNFSTAYKPPLSSVYNDFYLDVERNGIYDVTWYNTEDGMPVTSYATTSTNNRVLVVMPASLRNGKYGDGAFMVEYRCDAHWNVSVLNSNAPSNVLTGSDIETTSTGNVYFVGNDNRVHIMYYWNDVWQEAALNSDPGLVRANSDLARDPNNDKINYIATDSKIHQYYWWNDRWNETLVCATPNSVRTGSSLACSRLGDIYYFATDNKVHVYWWDNANSRYGEGSLGGTQNARFDSDIAIDNAINVFYVGTDNRIWRYYWSGGRWNNVLINPNAPANVKSGSALACDTRGNVYYVANEGPNGRIHRFQKSTSGWIEENFAPGTPTNTIMSGSDITIIPNGQIFFVGTDNRTHNYWFDGSSWYEATLNTNAPQNVSKYLASDDLGNVFYNSLNVGGSGNRIYVNYWGCSEVFKSTEINSSAEGSNENDQNSALALFPNPNTGDFHIRFKKQDGSPMITIHVFDIMGHMVYNESVENWTGDHSMNLSGLPNGTYMLRIISQDKSFTNRFVVLK